MHNDPIEPKKAAAAVVVICMATGALGGFAGCTFDFLQVTRVSVGSFSYMLLGANIGLAIGILACRRLRSPKTPTYNALYRSFLGLGYALAWLLVACMAFWVAAQVGRAYSRREVSFPLRFDRPNRREATFTAEFPGEHQVLLELERKIPYEELDAFAGGWSDPDKPPTPIPQRPVIVWRVEPLHRENQEAYWKGHSYGATIETEIGVFQAVEGQRYTFIAEVTQPAPRMQILNPRLQVQAIYRWTGPLTVTWIASFYAGLGAGGIGIVLLIRWIAAKRREAKASVAPDMDSQDVP